jgi:hypothetical protein
MDNIFLIAGLIAVIFLVFKFLEMRYVDKDTKPLKILIKDSLLVFICVIFGNFILEQLKPVIDESMAQSNPAAFTDNPPF